MSEQTSQHQTNWLRKRCKKFSTSVEAYSLYDEFRGQFPHIKEETFKRYVRDIMNGSNKNVEAPNVKIEQNYEKDEVFYQIESKDVKTLEDLVKFAKIDTDVWECTKIIANKWGHDLTQIKGWFKKKDHNSLSPEEYALKFRDLVKGFKPPILPEPRNIEHDDLVVTELAIFDHHLGQLSWGEETGSVNYDVNIACELYERVIDHFIEKLGSKTGRWILPIGNDFFNSDTIANTTTAGTPQVEDGRWQKTIAKGEELIVNQIARLRLIAPVDVIVIPGNHDKERAFHLGQFVSAWYRNDGYVTVDNGPRKHKYVKIGNTLIMITHGDGFHKGALPLFVAQDNPVDFGRAKFVEIQKGHFHSASEKKYQLSKSTFGIREEVIPALVPRDDWHDGKGYNSRRESLAICYTEYDGRDSVHYFHP